MAKRLSGHRSVAARGLGYAFHNAITKYGESAFNLISLIPLHSAEEAALVEIFLIEVWKANHRTHGYNLTSGGDGTVGRYTSATTRAKLRLARAKRKTTDQTRERLSKAKAGIPLTAAHARNIANSKTGVKRGPQTKEWIAKRLAANAGFKHTTEAKKRMSANKKAWWALRQPPTLLNLKVTSKHHI